MAIAIFVMALLVLICDTGRTSLVPQGEGWKLDDDDGGGFEARSASAL